MSLPVLRGRTEFKKNYKFIWQLGLPESSNLTDFAKNITNATNNGMLDRISSLSPYVNAILQKNDFFKKLASFFEVGQLDYVSNLCQSVNIPDDEIRIEYYDIGNVKYPVPTGIDLRNISVTYLDDSDETVYTFHKTWQQSARFEDTLSMNSLYSLALSGKFISYENTLDIEEYAGMYKLVKMSKNVSDALSLPIPKQDYFIKPKLVTQYPRIFPTKISRGTQDKSGNGLGKVTVTYERIPDFKNRPKPYVNFANKRFFG